MSIEKQIYDLVSQANPDNPLAFVQNIVKPMAKEKLDEYIMDCDECEISCNSVKTITRGNPNAPILIIGESVSTEQQELGQITFPLYNDKASDNLNQVLNYLNVNEDAIFYINSVNCYPNRNGNKRSSTVKERNNCKTFLDYAIKLVDPLLIICLGAVAVNGINEEIGKQKITDIRGQYFTYRGIPVMATFHPGYFNELDGHIPDELIEEYYNQFTNDITTAITDLHNQCGHLNIIK